MDPDHLARCRQEQRVLGPGGGIVDVVGSRNDVEVARQDQRFLRFKSLPAFTEITKAKPHKSLVEVKKRSGGRNNNGRLTARHIGGGHKQKYRKVDFKRRKHGIAAELSTRMAR